MASRALNGLISIVTGASRGVGKGIAIQLAKQGSKVYITGRTLELSDGSSVSGSLSETVREIHSRGGVCVPVQCDHSKDLEIKQLFERVKEENDGQLDILVNNAFSGVDLMLKERGTPFWEQSLNMWDEVNNVGLRNTYLCSIYGARLMVPRKNGIMINISSPSASVYVFNPTYGTGKAGVDRMAADCALELKKHNVTFLSLWPGAVCTEAVNARLKEEQKQGKNVEQYLTAFEGVETPNFVGKCVVAVACDPSILEKTGKALPTRELAMDYGITDEHGHSPDGKDVLLNFAKGYTL